MDKTRLFYFQNQKRKKSSYKINSILNLQQILFLILVIFFSFNRLNNSTPIINITIEGIGDQQFLNESFSDSIYEVYINGINNYNNITLIFNNTKLNDYNKMFKHLTTIRRIDFSNFNNSAINDMEGMFEGCSGLEQINFLNFDTSNILSMHSLFKGCSSLRSIDLSNLNLLLVTNISEMFFGCSSLSSINFGTIFFPSLLNVTGLFFGCSSLTSIDLSIFNFSLVKNMTNIFSGCASLQSINLVNIDTSSVETMSSLFYNCSSLPSLNLTKFNFAKVIYMDNMFYFCSNLENIIFGNVDTSTIESMESLFYRCDHLTSINLSNFKVSGAAKMENLFYNCSNLYYVLLPNFDFSNKINFQNMFFDCNSLLKIWVNSIQLQSQPTIICDIFNDLSLNITIYINDYVTKKEIVLNKYTSHCSDECLILNNTKIDINNKMCVKSCLYNSSNRYEYNNICYDKCPNGTLNHNYLCLDYDCNILQDYSIECSNNQPVGYYLDNNDIYQKCFNNCTFYNGEGIANESEYYPNNIETSLIEENKYISNIINLKENIINEPLENLINLLFEDLNLDYIDDGIDKKIIEKNMVIKLTSTQNQKKYEDNYSISMDLGQCENILKDEYNISNNNSLYLLQIISEESGMKIPKMEYKVYYPLYTKNNLTELNLNLCQDTKIEILCKVEINDTIDKYNASSDYYNDICYKTTSESNTDISLKDRRNQFIENNMTLCEENCV